MLSVLIRRVFLATYKVDFRKQLDGLLGESYRMGANPYDGDCVLFMKRDHTQLRAILGDPFGLYLISRRFEGGKIKGLPLFASIHSKKTISTGELSLLLEGAAYSIHHRTKERR